MYCIICDVEVAHEQKIEGRRLEEPRPAIKHTRNKRDRAHAFISHNVHVSSLMGTKLYCTDSQQELASPTDIASQEAGECGEGLQSSGSRRTSSVPS